jgi:hypothetical protein
MRGLWWVLAVALYILALGGVMAGLHGDLFSFLIAAGLAGWGWACQKKATRTPK